VESSCNPQQNSFFNENRRFSSKVTFLNFLVSFFYLFAKKNRYNEFNYESSMGIRSSQKTGGINP